MTASCTDEMHTQTCILATAVDEDYSLNLTPVGGGRDTFSGTFPAGVNSYSFEMEVVDDSVFEGVECVTLQLSVENSVALSTGLVLGNPLTKVACINDDERELSLCTACEGLLVGVCVCVCVCVCVLCACVLVC